MSKRFVGCMVSVTVAFFIAELLYLYNLISIPILKQISETMWILGLLSGCLITASFAAVFNYKNQKKQKMGKDRINNFVDKLPVERKTNVVRIKKYK